MHAQCTIPSHVAGGSGGERWCRIATFRDARGSYRAIPYSGQEGWGRGGGGIVLWKQLVHTLRGGGGGEQQYCHYYSSPAMAMFALLRASEEAVAHGEHLVICPGGVGLARALAFYLERTSHMGGKGSMRGGGQEEGYTRDDEQEEGYASDDEQGVGYASAGEQEEGYANDDGHESEKDKQEMRGVDEMGGYYHQPTAKKQDLL